MWVIFVMLALALGMLCLEVILGEEKVKHKARAILERGLSETGESFKENHDGSD